MTHNEEHRFDAIVMHENDSVATVLSNVLAGTRIRVQSAGAIKVLELTEDVPLCHKVAVKVTKKGEAVLKNGHLIGFATMRITAGSHVHIHNLAGRDPADFL